MLGQPISMLLPQVVGFRLDGELPDGATATDLVLTVTEMLRERGVVSKFVEFFGPGLHTLGLADRVQFAGQIPHNEMPAVYAIADVVVQPSQLFEPFGLVAAEAMACGRPVVASDLPGVRRVISMCGGGVLVRTGDADDLATRIDQVLGDRSIRTELGRRGRAGAEQRYDSRRIGPLLEEAYIRAIESGPSRR